jgi:hypothetical protein
MLPAPPGGCRTAEPPLTQTPLVRPPANRPPGRRTPHIQASAVVTPNLYPKPYEFIGFGRRTSTKPYKNIGFCEGAPTKPYELIWFGVRVVVATAVAEFRGAAAAVVAFGCVAEFVLAVSVVFIVVVSCTKSYWESDQANTLDSSIANRFCCNNVGKQVNNRMGNNLGIEAVEHLMTCLVRQCLYVFHKNNEKPRGGPTQIQHRHISRPWRTLCKQICVSDACPRVCRWQGFNTTQSFELWWSYRFCGMYFYRLGQCVDLVVVPEIRGSTCHLHTLCVNL